MNKIKRILFVCTGNICRSPSAEGIFKHLAKSRGVEDLFEVDSAGLIAYHIGESPDPRSTAEAKKYGVDLSDQRARKFKNQDFDDFDYLFAMDYGHYSDMKSIAGINQRHKIRMFLEPIRDEVQTSEVPDPYYGGSTGFTDVYKLIEKGCNTWLDRWLTID